MIALIKTFTLQPTSVVSNYSGGNKALIKTFTLQPTSVVSNYSGGTSSISSAFAVKIDRLPDSLGGNKVASSFALAYGGYELDGVILDKELEKTKVIRQK